MFWAAFNHEGKLYDLHHLHPREVVYVQPSKDNKPERRYRTKVVFSLHCFTRELRAGEQPSHNLFYTDGRETRIFDFHRYALSVRLPGIIDNLLKYKCFSTGKGNFFTVQLINEDGTATIKYEVFFKPYKPAAKAPLTLIIESAYERDEAHPRKERVTQIGFHVILFNTLNNKPIRMAD